MRVPIGGARRRLEADPPCTNLDTGPVWDALVAEVAANGLTVTSCADLEPFCEPEPAVRASCMRSCGVCPPAAADDEEAEVAGFKVTVHARFVHHSLHSALNLAHFRPGVDCSTSRRWTSPTSKRSSRCLWRRSLPRCRRWASP